MADIRAFCALRPAGERSGEIAALPYDVYDRKEAKEAVKDRPLSFLNIDRPEVHFSDDEDMYADKVYDKAGEVFSRMKENGCFVKDDKPYYYIYELTMNGRVQTGIVAVASVDDYDSGIIKKHENTRREKEEDRVRHVDRLSAQTGPIFLAYRGVPVINSIVSEVKKNEDLFDFTSEDGVRHRVFIIHDEGQIKQIQKAFSGIDSIYIADGHHRAASAVRVSKMRRDAYPGYSGKEEFNYFLSVLFPGEELYIMDYNRLIADLNGHTPEKIIELIEESACVIPIQEAAHPETKGSFTMCLEGRWYMCSFYPEKMNDDPVKGLDVSLLQDFILEPVFGIKDPKTDKRIDFAGGIRGLDELERRVNTDMRVAFAMYPTSMDELMNVADKGLLMPPKSTWFEPKLRSGLFIHEIEGGKNV